MTCTSCGDKPKGSSKGFPKAVVEINNPESLVLLRKVVIPASMGTEEDVPPAIGKYFNVLLQYESNGHIYLYSSDGIPTAIEANIPQEVLDRIDQLEIDVDLLETGLANETEARETADTALGGRVDTVANNLATETANRISAGEDLQADIAAEATARANGDAALNTAITSEVTARQEADTNLQNQIAQEAQARAAADTAINGAITAEASTRQTADAGLQSQIDAITASSDVKDIVGTKAELNNYDTSTLGNNDIIKVLQDESENNATTYYRWNATTQQFTLIGEEGPYYTKSQADTLLNAKQNTLTAGSNVQIVNDTISATDTTYTAGTGLALNGTQFSVDTTAIATQSDLTAGLATKQDTLTAGANIQINNNTISATDTTYSAFTGTDGQTAGTAGLVPAPATTDAGKFLKADGTWDTAGGSSVTVVQTTGTSTTDVMSQNAVTSMVFADAGTNSKIRIGNTNNINTDCTCIGAGTAAPGLCSVNLGNSSKTTTRSTALGYASEATGANSLALGFGAKAGGPNSISFPYSTANTQGQVQFQLTGSEAGQGYNYTAYRLLSGVYDGQSAHDAATVGQLNGRVLQNAGAPTTATVGTVGQLLEDTTNGKLYQCTAIDTTDPNNPSYTWNEVGAGGGGGAEFIELTTADYNWNSSTGATGTPNCVALWLLPSGIYKGPASTSIEVRATRTQDYSMGAGFSSYAIVKECENTNTNRAIVTYVDGANGSVVEYYSIDENGQNYSTKNFPNVVQTTGTSTTNVMSQNATTSMVFADPGTGSKVKIGTGTSASSDLSVVVGSSASDAGAYYNTLVGSGSAVGNGRSACVGIGFQARVSADNSIAIGRQTKIEQASSKSSVALGSWAEATRKGEVNIGAGTSGEGYNSTNYRVLGGVHDPVDNHDAATKGYVDTAVAGAGASAFTTNEWNALWA